MIFSSSESGVLDWIFASTVPASRFWKQVQSNQRLGLIVKVCAYPAVPSLNPKYIAAIHPSPGTLKIAMKINHIGQLAGD
jgi:hypothetical protein